MKDIKLSIEQALDLLENLHSDKSSREYQYALTMAYRALARRIPREPIEGEVNIEKFYIYHCPACDNSLVAFFEEICPTCGQVINWDNVYLHFGGKNESP